MPIIIDQITTHDLTPPVSGNNTVPPGITGNQWCHLVSATTQDGVGSLEELQDYLTLNIETIKCDPANIRTPADGSNVTYVGLSPDQRTAAIAASALANRPTFVFTHAFDYAGQDPEPTTYEP